MGNIKVADTKRSNIGGNTRKVWRITYSSYPIQIPHPPPKSICFLSLTINYSHLTVEAKFNLNHLVSPPPSNSPKSAPFCSPFCNSFFLKLIQAQIFSLFFLKQSFSFLGALSYFFGSVDENNVFQHFGPYLIHTSYLSFFYTSKISGE